MRDVLPAEKKLVLWNGLFDLMMFLIIVEKHDNAVKYTRDKWLLRKCKEDDYWINEEEKGGTSEALRNRVVCWQPGILLGPTVRIFVNPVWTSNEGKITIVLHVNSLHFINLLSISSNERQKGLTKSRFKYSLS